MILIAQCNYLINDQKLSPIFLFDEIASHLDIHNRKILLDMINRFEIQFFLTGTDKNLFSFVSTKAQFYNITDIMAGMHLALLIKIIKVHSDKNHKKVL